MWLTYKWQNTKLCRQYTSTDINWHGNIIVTRGDYSVTVVLTCPPYVKPSSLKPRMMFNCILWTLADTRHRNKINTLTGWELFLNNTRTVMENPGGCFTEEDFISQPSTNIILTIHTEPDLIHKLDNCQYFSGADIPKTGSLVRGIFLNHNDFSIGKIKNIIK